MMYEAQLIFCCLTAYQYVKTLHKNHKKKGLRYADAVLSLSPLLTHSASGGIKFS